MRLCCRRLRSLRKKESADINTKPSITAPTLIPARAPEERDGVDVHVGMEGVRIVKLESICVEWITEAFWVGGAAVVDAV